MRLLLPAALLLITLNRGSADESAPLNITPFPEAVIQTVWTQKIWSGGNHNAFPRIARLGDFYYVTFRRADSHRADKGTMVVIRAPVADLASWKQVAEFTRDYDRRDPLLFENHGKIQLVFHSQEDFYSQSSDGLTWTEPRELETEFVPAREGSGLQFSSQRRWLFRIRRGPDGAFYSLARCGIKEKGDGVFGLITYRSEDGVHFKAMHSYGEGPTSALPQAGGSGWGHESDVTWTRTAPWSAPSATPVPASSLLATPRSARGALFPPAPGTSAARPFTSPKAAASCSPRGRFPKKSPWVFPPCAKFGLSPPTASRSPGSSPVAATAPTKASKMV